MDPVSLGTVSLGMTALSGGLNAVGAIGGGNAKASAYRYQAGIADLNQKLNLQNAERSTAVGEVKALQSGLKARNQMGLIRTGQAASGLDVAGSSAQAVRDSQQTVSTYDEDVIRNDAAWQAYGYQTKAAENEAQGRMLRSAATNAQNEGWMSALGSIIGTAGSVAGRWSQGNNIGMWGGRGGGEYSWIPRPWD